MSEYWMHHVCWRAHYDRYDSSAMLDTWMVDNLDMGDWIDSKEVNFTVVFKHEADALAFKLKFGL